VKASERELCALIAEKNSQLNVDNGDYACGCADEIREQRGEVCR